MPRFRRMTHSLLAVLLTVAALVLTAVSALFFSVVQSSVSNFERYVISSRRTETVSAGGLFSQDLEALYTLMYSSLSDTTLTKLRLYLANSTLTYRYLELAKLMEGQLFSIETSLDFAESVEILLPDVQRIITSGSIVRYDQDRAVYVDELLNTTDQKVLVSDGTLILRTGKYTGIGQYRHDVVIYCRISKAAMLRYLSKFGDGGSGGNLSLFLNDGDGPRLFASWGAALSEADSQNIARLIAGQEIGQAQYVSGQERYLITWTETSAAPMKLCHVTPMEVIDEQLREYRAMIAWVCALILLLLAGLFCFIYSLILKPLLSVQRGLKRVENGDLSTRLGHTWSSEFQDIYGQFDRMTEHLQQLIEREYELRLLNTKAEVKQLRYQINPHFLYNTYFNLRAMLIDEEYDQAVRLADLMGRYLRYITVSSHDFAPLAEELEHAAAYMEIQRIRFGSRIEARVDPLPGWAQELCVPRLVLQPLIENAFEHGVKHQEGPAVIAIRLQRRGQDVSVFVEDSGANATDALLEHARKLIQNGLLQEGTEGVALVNIHKRLTLLYAKGSGLFISRSALGGFCSEIRMKEALAHDADADCGR